MRTPARKEIIEWSYAAAVAIGLIFGVPALERATAPVRTASHLSGGLSVSVFDVGQGDAILAQEGDRQILIDGGPDDTVLERLGSVMPFGDRSIDLVILTHPHSDHVDGLVTVFERYDVGRVLATDVSAPTFSYRRWRELIAERGIPVDDPRDTLTEKVGGMEFVVLSAGRQADVRSDLHDGNSDGMNDSSIVGMLKYGERRFLMMGDATSAVEEKLLEARADLSADLLKVGHHGSAYSTNSAFLAAVAPGFAVVSVGAKNSYGNPAWRVLRLLDAFGVAVRRTDEDGTVTALTDGKSLQVYAENVR